MATVGELSDPYTNFMRTPRRRAGCCAICTTFIEPGYQRCFLCNFNQRWLAAVLPISYADRGGQLHRNLAGYKRWAPASAGRTRLQLAAVLWRFVLAHESCLATAGASTASISSPLSHPVIQPATSIIHCARSSVRSSNRPAIATSACCGEAQPPMRSVAGTRGASSPFAHSLMSGSCSSTTPGPPEPARRSQRPRCSRQAHHRRRTRNRSLHQPGLRGQRRTSRRGATHVLVGHVRVAHAVGVDERSSRSADERRVMQDSRCANRLAALGATQRPTAPARMRPQGAPPDSSVSLSRARDIRRIASAAGARTARRAGRP